MGHSFDVQGGGSDLVFPHHEMSAAEAQAAYPGTPFARAYVHAGMVGYRGEKMSKSLGNLVFVSALREQGVDPTVIRLALLAHHYRSDWEWTESDLPAAVRRLEAWRAALPTVDTARAGELVADVRAALAVDLDAPGAIEVLDRWAGQAAAVGGTGDAEGAAVVRGLVEARLGITL